MGSLEIELISGVLPLAHGRPWASGNTPLIKNDSLHEVPGSNPFRSEKHSTHPPVLPTPPGASACACSPEGRTSHATTVSLLSG